ncbi:MAG: hypothetical protein AAFR36_29120 [Bacteroidota bacterium]
MEEKIKAEVLPRIKAHFEYSINQHSSIWVGNIIRWMMYAPKEEFIETPTPNDLLQRYGIDYAQLCMIAYFWKRIHNHLYYTQPDLVQDYVLQLIEAIPAEVEHSVAYHQYLVELMFLLRPFMKPLQAKYVNDCIQFHLSAIRSKPSFSQYSQFYGEHFQMRVVGRSVDPSSINIMLSSASNHISQQLRAHYALSEVSKQADLYLFKFTLGMWGIIREDGGVGIGEGAYQKYDTSDGEASEESSLAQAARIVQEITGLAKTVKR